MKGGIWRGGVIGWCRLRRGFGGSVGCGWGEICMGVLLWENDFFEEVGC